MSDHEAKIALLIDADNASAGRIELVLSELAKYGRVIDRRAYGNWKSPGLQAWENVLLEYAIRPMQQFDYTKGKNATDVALVIDAMDLLHSGRLEAVGIVSSDCDFTPLVMRLVNSGLKVYGFGERKAPPAFQKACSRFTLLEALGECTAADSGEPGEPVRIRGDSASAEKPHSLAVTALERKSTKELKADTRLVQLLRNAIAATAGDDGWAALSGVGAHIGNQVSFDSRNYGYSKLSDLFAASGLFSVDRRNGAVYVRDERNTRREFVPAGEGPAAPSLPRTSGGTGVLRDRYTALLKKKHWKFPPREHLLAVQGIIGNMSAASRNSLLSACLDELAAGMTPTEIRAAISTCFKARCFARITDANVAGDPVGIFEYQGSDDLFLRIDRALLARLLAACRETGTQVDPWELRTLLYADYSIDELPRLLAALERSDEPGISQARESDH